MATAKEEAARIAETRREAVQLYYRDCGHEVRIWTLVQAGYGAFEVMPIASFNDFRIHYIAFHGESSIRELHDCDRYEPGDNLDGK